MPNRAAAVAAMALVAALSVSASPADAATPTPAPLPVESASLTVSVDRPPAGDPVVCDSNNFVYCGFVSVRMVLSVADRTRPGPTDFVPLFTAGTVDLTRVYGCADQRGRRVHRYDTKVVQRDYSIINRRNIPFRVPTTDMDTDTLEVAAFGLLEDAQPGNCPRRTKPRLYQLTAQNAELTLESEWTAIPASHTYEIPGKARWRGAARTPKL